MRFVGLKTYLVRVAIATTIGLSVYFGVQVAKSYAQDSCIDHAKIVEFHAKDVAGHSAGPLVRVTDYEKVKKYDEQVKKATNNQFYLEDKTRSLYFVFYPSYPNVGPVYLIVEVDEKGCAFMANYVPKDVHEASVEGLGV